MAKKAHEHIGGFVDFVREQGVVGLAVGFILGGAVSKVVSSLVENIINPLLGAGLGSVSLDEKAIEIGDVAIEYGAFISTVVDFLVIAAVVYFGVKALKLDQLDKAKD